MVEIGSDRDMFFFRGSDPNPNPDFFFLELKGKVSVGR